MRKIKQPKKPIQTPRASGVVNINDFLKPNRKMRRHEAKQLVDLGDVGTYTDQIRNFGIDKINRRKWD